MSGDRSVEVETAIVKLARSLDVKPDDLSFLDHVEVDVIRDLNWKGLDLLRTANRRRLQNVATATKLVPTALAATIGQKMFGAVLCAQLVGLLEPTMSARFAKHMTTGFLADVAARMDPRAMSALAGELDRGIMKDVANELAERGDHITLSHFVGYVPARVMADILGSMDDASTPLRIARYVDDPAHLDPIVAEFSDERIAEVAAAVEADDVLADARHLMANVGEEQHDRILAAVPPELRDLL